MPSRDAGRQHKALLSTDARPTNRLKKARVRKETRKRQKNAATKNRDQTSRQFAETGLVHRGAGEQCKKGAQERGEQERGTQQRNTCGVHNKDVVGRDPRMVRRKDAQERNPGMARRKGALDTQDIMRGMQERKEGCAKARRNLVKT